MHLPPMLLSFMKTEWLMRFLLTPLPMNALQCTWWMLYNACDETIQNNLVNTTTDFFSLPEHNLLDTLETIVAKKSNQAVYQLTFSSLFQSEGESVTDFIVWLKSTSPDCEFSCPGCHKDLKHIHIKDQIIWGLYNEKLQTDILAKVSHLIQLEDIIKHWESAQRDQLALRKSTKASTAHTSLYQQQNSHRHGQRRSNNRPTKWPTRGQFCHHCKIHQHFASACQQKPSESANALIAQVYYDSRSDAYHTISPIQDINEIPALICSIKSPVLVNIFPNSGASIYLAGSHHLQQLNLKQEDLIHCHRKVKAVEGSKLICHGRLPMNLTLLLANMLQPRKYMFMTK